LKERRGKDIVTGKRGRRRKQLQYDLKEKRGYWKYNAEALDRIVLITDFGRGIGTVLTQTAVGMPVVLSSLLEFIRI